MLVLVVGNGSGEGIETTIATRPIQCASWRIVTFTVNASLESRFSIDSWRCCVCVARLCWIRCA